MCFICKKDCNNNLKNKFECAFKISSRIFIGCFGVIFIYFIIGLKIFHAEAFNNEFKLVKAHVLKREQEDKDKIYNKHFDNIENMVLGSGLLVCVSFLSKIAPVPLNYIMMAISAGATSIIAKKEIG